MKYLVSSETLKARDMGLLPFRTESEALERAIEVLENLNLPGGPVVELYVGMHQGEPALMTRYI